MSQYFEKKVLIFREKNVIFQEKRGKKSEKQFEIYAVILLKFL